MFIKVEVAKKELLNGDTVLSGISESRIINKNQIVTAVNKRALCKDNEFYDICKMTFVNGESIEVYGNAEILDGDIIINNE